MTVDSGSAARDILTEWLDADRAVDGPDADERRRRLEEVFAEDAVLSLPRRTVTGHRDVCAYVADHPRVGADDLRTERRPRVTWTQGESADRDTHIATVDPNGPSGATVRWTFRAREDGRITEVHVVPVAPPASAEPTA